MSLRAKMREKRKLLDDILNDLEDLKKRGFENMYAVDENIKFFKALYSLPKYIRWLIKEMPKIDGSRLLELSDFHLHDGKWERILQEELLEIEQWKFPDNLLQFRKELLKQISELSKLHGGRNSLLMSLGSGMMEIERQLITTLGKENYAQKIVFVGVDNSQASLDAAKNNLNELDIPIIQTNSLKPDELEAIKKKYAERQFIIILLKSDVFVLDGYFSSMSVDLIYHSKFRHHLIGNQKQQLDNLVTMLSSRIVEADLLNNLFMFIVPIIARTRWFHPVLLNGGMFSALRSPTKKETASFKKQGWRVKTFPDGYIRVFRNRNI